MKRALRFVIAFAVALVFLPFLPLYVERTMTHVMFAHGGGGAIEWGWRRCALNRFWSDYHYLRPEQNPGLWLAVDVALVFTYALAIALIVHLVFHRTTAEKAQRNYAKR